MKAAELVLATAAAALFAGAAAAQTDTFAGTATGTGQTAAEERNEDLIEDIEDDRDRELNRFGNEGRKLGFDGSVALRGTASRGNDETAILGIGANLGFYDGANGYELTLSYAFSESENDDGRTETDEDSLLYNFQYTRDFSPALYGFVKLQGSYNGDDDDNAVDAEAFRQNDVFLGFGAGYRIINERDRQWSVQAGPGYRFSNFGNIDDAILSGDIVDGEGDDISEAAFAISSNYSQSLNEQVFFSIDTSIITSSEDTVLYNDAGVNIALNDRLAMRTSLQTEYHTDPIGSRESTDHTLGVSLVFNLN